MKNMKHERPVPFNELQEFYRATMNRIKGITNNQPIRSMFPVGDMRRNRFRDESNEIVNKH